MNNEPLNELKRVIESYPTSVIYQPIKDEVDCLAESFPLDLHANYLVIPADKNSNPFEWASMCAEKVCGDKAAIFIPGREFDIYGTRRGNGGGWYDRFLSQIPKDWLRVGIAHANQITENRLSRESWDEPVNWILSEDSGKWIVYKV